MLKNSLGVSVVLLLTLCKNFPFLVNVSDVIEVLRRLNVLLETHGPTSTQYTVEYSRMRKNIEDLFATTSPQLNSPATQQATGVTYSMPLLNDSMDLGDLLYDTGNQWQVFFDCLFDQREPGALSN